MAVWHGTRHGSVWSSSTQLTFLLISVVCLGYGCGSMFSLGQVNQLDLSAYADELERQGEGKRGLQLDSIVEEIRYPYR